KNYEQTLKDVRAYHRAQRLPFNYYQLDSWWYYKGKSQGVTDWSPRTDVFPHGLAALHQSLGLPLVTHNRWWDSATGYATQFHFIREKETALPDDQRFWDSLMGRLKQNGGAVYEQDWLIDQFHKMEALHTDVGLGRRWLTQMGRAAQDNGLTIQYCMALPSEFLESSEIP